MAPANNAKEGFHQFRPANDAEPHGSFEVFYAPFEAKWYWWACWPRYLPDGEAEGPYDTSVEAYNAAQDQA